MTVESLAKSMYELTREEIIANSSDRRGAMLMYPKEFDMYDGDHVPYLRWARLAIRAMETMK